MKKLHELFRGFTYIVMIVSLCYLYYEQGRDDFIRNSYYYVVPTTYIQNPPQIRTNCYQRCENVEFVTWEEYVKRYQERMLPQ